MIELIFSRGGAIALENAIHIGEKSSRIERVSSDIVALWLMGDVGDISDLPDWTSRLKIMREIAGNSEMDCDDWVVEEAKRAEAAANRLKSAASSGEAVRIWWSDAADETCGYYWAMSILKDSVGSISSIKVPRLWPTAYGCNVNNGTGELLAEDLLSIMHLEKRIGHEERNAISLLWGHLVYENSPLRVVLNGVLCSVPENFYDYTIFKTLPDGDFKVIEAVGRAIAEGLGGHYDWWFARRIRSLITCGEFEVIEQSDNFYQTVIRKIEPE